MQPRPCVTVLSLSSKLTQLTENEIKTLRSTHADISGLVQSTKNKNGLVVVSFKCIKISNILK